jgi:hypothetical protein
LRAAGKFRPDDGKAERLQFLLEQPARLEQQERAVFLIADSQSLVGGFRAANREGGEDRCGGEGAHDFSQQSFHCQSFGLWGVEFIAAPAGGKPYLDPRHITI